MFSNMDVIAIAGKSYFVWPVPDNLRLPSANISNHEGNHDDSTNSGGIPSIISTGRRVSASPNWRDAPGASAWIESVRQHHEETISKPRECELTNDGRRDLLGYTACLNKEDMLNKMKKDPEKKHVCTVCFKHFSKAHVLRDHLRRHKGEKPFACGECGRCFVTKTEMGSHMGRKHYKLVQKR